MATRRSQSQSEYVKNLLAEIAEKEKVISRQFGDRRHKAMKDNAMMALFNIKTYLNGHPNMAELSDEFREILNEVGSVGHLPDIVLKFIKNIVEPDVGISPFVKKLVADITAFQTKLQSHEMGGVQRNKAAITDLAEVKKYLEKDPTLQKVNYEIQEKLEAAKNNDASTAVREFIDQVITSPGKRVKKKP